MNPALWASLAAFGLAGSEYAAFASCWQTKPRVDHLNRPVYACSQGTPTPPPGQCGDSLITQNDQLTDAANGYSYGKSNMSAVQKVCQIRFAVFDENGDCVYTYRSVTVGSTEASGSACPAIDPPTVPIVRPE